MIGSIAQTVLAPETTPKASMGGASGLAFEAELDAMAGCDGRGSGVEDAPSGQAPAEPDDPGQEPAAIDPDALTGTTPAGPARLSAISAADRVPPAASPPDPGQDFAAGPALAAEPRPTGAAVVGSPEAPEPESRGPELPETEAAEGRNDGPGALAVAMVGDDAAEGRTPSVVTCVPGVPLATGLDSPPVPGDMAPPREEVAGGMSGRAGSSGSVGDSLPVGSTEVPPAVWTELPSANPRQDRDRHAMPDPGRASGVCPAAGAQGASSAPAPGRMAADTAARAIAPAGPEDPGPVAGPAAALGAEQSGSGPAGRAPPAAPSGAPAAALVGHLISGSIAPARTERADSASAVAGAGAAVEVHRSGAADSRTIAATAMTETGASTAAPPATSGGGRESPDPVSVKASTDLPAAESGADAGRAAYLSGSSFRAAEFRPAGVPGTGQPVFAVTGASAPGPTSIEPASGADGGAGGGGPTPTPMPVVSIRRTDEGAAPAPAVAGAGEQAVRTAAGASDPVAAAPEATTGETPRAADPQRVTAVTATAVPVPRNAGAAREAPPPTDDGGVIAPTASGNQATRFSRTRDVAALRAFESGEGSAAVRPSPETVRDAPQPLALPRGPAPAEATASPTGTEPEQSDPGIGATPADAAIEGVRDAPPSLPAAATPDHARSLTDPVRAAPDPAGNTPAREPPSQAEAEAPEAGDDTVEVVLRPDDLGRVKMTMAQDGDLLRVTVHADRAETLDLMRRHSDQLGAELRLAGFAGASFSFGGRDGQPPPRGRPVIEAEQREGAPVGAAASASTAGLDLRI